MTQDLPRVRPGILDIAPYVPGQSTIAGHTRVLKLSANEGALGPSPKAIEAYRAVGPDLHRYPDGASTALREAIARHHGIEADRIVCGTGSDELIVMLARAFAGPGDEIIQTLHGFAMYEIAARSVGATPLLIPEHDLTADIDAILDAVTPATRLVYLANPNNPTGTMLPRRDIHRLHAGLRPDIVLVLDAAYAEFVEDSDYEPGLDLASKTENVVMLRTFSKIYALGGLRVGWAYGSARMAGILDRLRGTFNLSNAAQAAAIAALDDQDHVTLSRQHNTEWRGWLVAALRQSGLDVRSTACNFVLVRFRDAAEARDADAQLRRAGIIVRGLANYHLPDYLRITIGTEVEVKAAASALADFARLL